MPGLVLRRSSWLALLWIGTACSLTLKLYHLQSRTGDSVDAGWSEKKWSCTGINFKPPGLSGLLESLKRRQKDLIQLNSPGPNLCSLRSASFLARKVTEAPPTSQELGEPHPFLSCSPRLACLAQRRCLVIVCGASGFPG